MQPRPRQAESSDGVAIIGMSMNLPEDVKDETSLWNFCKGSQCATRPIPHDRFDASHYYHPIPGKKGHFYVNGGSYLNEDITLFDAPFFNLTELEATAMDPQHRLMLETAFTAIENAGLDVRTLAGRPDVGVFAAGQKAEYELGANLDQFTAGRYTATGNAMTMFANRLSYFFNFRGPSIVVDVACASSLTAVHLAVESIRKGDCSIAVVGGAFLQINPAVIGHMGNIGALGKDGKCYSYDHRAEGYGRGEGVSCIVLRGERDAQMAEDAIRAVIRGSGMNHCGRSQGITMPNCDAQTELIRRVYRDANLRPEDTVLVEGHGTGTAAGDPIEVKAIYNGMGFAGKRDLPMFLGSVKSNFGHLEAASGVLSVIKCVLMLERGQILPSANFEKANPGLEAECQRITIPTKCYLWPENTPRRASINNFGFGGSNAHMVLEAYTPAVDSPVMDSSGPALPRLFYFSAKDATALSNQLTKMAEYCDALDVAHEDEEKAFLENMSYTLACRRSRFDYQHALAASSKDQLVEKLFGPSAAPRLTLHAQSIVYCFTGQGSQWAGMGQELMHLPVFAESMRKADRFLQEELGASFSLIEEMFRPEETSKINTATISQPAVTALQMSLVLLLESWRIKPRAVCGHSSGEIAAAFAAGYLGFSSSMAAAYHRGQVSAANVPTQGPPQGAMLAVGTSAEHVQHMLQSTQKGRVGVACYNSGSSITLSGDREAVEEVKEQLDAEGTFNRLLKVDQAYHSHRMAQPGEQYLAELEKILPKLRQQGDKGRSAGADTTMFFSSVTEELLTREDVSTGKYWTSNLVSPVRFAGAMAQTLVRTQMANIGNAICLLEIGPHSALSGPVREIAKTVAKDAPKYFSTLQRKQDGYENIMNTACSLLNEGFPLHVSEIGKTTTTASRRQLLTSLPSYQFNKTRKYEHSTRLIKNLRHGTSAWNAILGHKLPFSTNDGLECRNVFSLDDVPWLRDHHVKGSAVFPMTGYISAVTEAIALAQASKRESSTLKGYKIREMTIGKAFRLPEGVDNEMFTVLQPLDTGSRGSVGSSWYTFKVSSWNHEAGFTEHCTGLVTMIWEQDEDTISDTFSEKLRWATDMRKRLGQDCKNKIAPDAFYRQTQEVGIKYGGPFRGVNSLTTGGNEAFGTVRFVDTTGSMPAEYQNRLIVHPAFLDSCLQVGLCNTAGNPGRLARMRAFVPTFIEEVFIAADIPQSEGDEMHIYYHDLEHDPMARSSSGHMTGFSGDHEYPSVEFRGLKLTNVSDDEQVSAHAESINPQRVEWIDHPEFISSESMRQLIGTIGEFRDDQPKLQLLDAASLHYMKQALDASPETPKEPHLVQFKLWMKTHLANATDEDLKLPSDFQKPDQFRDMDFVNAVGPHLPAILSGETDALSVLHEAKLATIYDEAFIFGRSAAIGARVVRDLSLQNVSLRILEVGAGTGAMTARILEEIDGRFEMYCYTDISRAFLEPAKAKFSKWASKMEFGALDLDADPAAQGFQLGSFDVVIAADVVHATPSILRSLKNIRSLLKPHGILAMLELSRFAPAYFPFATLPGFWGRPDGPALRREEWQKELSDAGFTSDNAFGPDWPSGKTMHHIVWSHNGPSEDAKAEDRPKVILSNSDANSNVTLRLEEVMQADSITVKTLANLGNVEDVKDRHFICIEDMAKPILTATTETDFEALKSLTANAAGILWVVRSCSSQPEQEARANFAYGFARTMRLEYQNLKFVVLHLVDADQDTTTKLIDRIYRHAFVDKPGAADSEVEFHWQDDHFKFPRLTNDAYTKDFVDVVSNPDRTVVEPFWQKDKPLHATLHQLGLFDAIHYQPLKFSLADPLPDEEVLVEIRATGLNFKDVLLCLGRVPWQDIGLECSGVVLAAGQKARQNVRPGDRVVLYGGGGLFASHTRCHVDQIAKIPDWLDFSEAASIPLVFATAYEGLVNVAHLQAGEKVLIHAAAGGVGQAAIILCQHYGAEIYCTVGTQEKRELIMSKYGISSERIFSSRTAEFASSLSVATGGKGVDVVLNSLVGDLLQASWRALAPGGRFIEIGKRDAQSNARLDMVPFDKAVTFAAVDLALMHELWPKRGGKLLKDVMALFNEKKIKPVSPINDHSVSDLVPALRLLQAGKHVGKVVVSNNADAKVRVRALSKRETTIKADVTYLITGGTGGLGRSFCKWLINQGAQNVCLVSRSGRTSSPQLEEVCEYASSEGAKVFITKCDVSRSDQVTSLIEAVEEQGMPKIRGIIHGAMYLNDALFENSTYSDWRGIQAPKVEGAINLHNAFAEPDDLDFFICLSSVAGVAGNLGQAAYAGSNAFLDAFAGWRGRQGLAAASINLPGIADAGYVAEAMSTGATAFTDKVYGASLSESQLHTVMISAMQRACFNPQGNGNNITVGLSGSRAFYDAFSGSGPILEVLCAGKDSGAGSAGSGEDGDSVAIREMLAQAEDAAARDAVLLDGLMKKISEMMMLPLEELTPEKAISDIGVDSLVAVELRNWIAKELQASIPVMDIVGCSSLRSLSELIAGRSSLMQNDK